MKKIFVIIFSFICFTQSFAAEYRIIVDAGSTGNRLHLFQYEMNKDNLIIKDIFSESNKTPLSSFENNPEQAGVSLELLFNDALTHLNSQQINPKNVQVNIFATAGMRLVSRDSQDAIYSDIKRFLLQHYPFQIGKIETITGTMEGFYAWLDINYLAQTFQNRTPSIGIIDMGGASTQIAFETQNINNIEDIIKFNLNDQTYTVFSKSFLGLGQDQAQYQMNQLPFANRCYPLDYLVNGVKGSWDFNYCTSLYKQVINNYKVAEQMLPIENQHFYAFSGAYYTYHFFDADKTPDQASLEKQIQLVCTKSWDDFKKEFTNIDEQYLSSYCSNAAYMDNLFYGTYHIDGKKLNVVNQVNNQHIDWTLGALLFSLKESSA